MYEGFAGGEANELPMFFYTLGTGNEFTKLP